MEMEAHNDIRKNITWLWTRNQTRIVNRIHNEWKIDDFTEEEIHTVCGIIEVNCFEVGHEGAKGRALYPTSFLMAHDCSSNSTHTDNPENFSMQIRAMRDIKKGESITVNYGYILMVTSDNHNLDILFNLESFISQIIPISGYIEKTREAQHGQVLLVCMSKVQ